MQHITHTTATDVRERQPTLAVLPVGSFEQHGSHLPLATDTIVAVAIAGRIAEDYNVLTLPPITISCSHEHSSWPGTVSISHNTLAAIIDDVAKSLDRQGINRLAIVNAHGGNYSLSNVVQEANAVRAGSMTLFPTRDDWKLARKEASMDTSDHDDMHAGELEVSIVEATVPTAVRADRSSNDHEASERSMLLVKGMAAYTHSGVIGRPSAGNLQKGEAALASLSRSFKRHMEALDGR